MSKTKEQIQQEALLAIDKFKRAGIEVSVGVGKTKIGLMDMNRQNNGHSRYLVVAPKLTILQSWKDEIDKWELTHLHKHIKFVTYRSLVKEDLCYDTVYLDECHSLTKNHNEWLKEYVRRGGRTIGLTGTYPVRKTTEKGKMCNFYCPKVYTYETDDAVEDNLLNDYHIIVHELNLSNKKTLPKKGKFGEYYISEAKDYEYWENALNRGNGNLKMLRILRMKAMQNYTTKFKYAQALLNEQTDKTLIFANTKVQAEQLCSYSHHSSNKQSKENLQLFKDSSITKLSAVEQLSEGVNIPELKVGIIMHSYSNNRKATQKIGRLLRLNPDDKATVHILCYANTIDRTWVTQALKGYNQDKITWKKAKAYAELYQ